MIGLLQRVSSAQVVVNGETIAAIGSGLLVLIGFERGDGKAQIDRLVQRLLGYRVFADKDGKMNLNVRDIGGGLLLVPQFTLAADTRKGMRPSFTPAAEPEHGKALFEYLLSSAQHEYPHTSAGLFGADMQVSLTNDGPVTFWLRVAPGEEA